LLEDFCQLIFEFFNFICRGESRLVRAHLDELSSHAHLT
jgi:hypothetical protein